MRQLRTRSWARSLPAVAWAATIWLLSSSSSPPGGRWLDLPHLDKVAHTGLFLVQAMLLRFAGLGALPSLLLAAGWGLVDEVHQHWVPGRTTSMGDLLADTIGATLGTLAPRLWRATRAS